MAVDENGNEIPEQKPEEKPNQPTKVSFDEHQQKKVDEIHDSAFERGFKKAQTQYEANIEAERKRIKQLEDDLAAARTEKPKSDDKPKGDEKPGKEDPEEKRVRDAKIQELEDALKALRDERDTFKGELETVRTGTVKDRKRALLQDAAQKAGVEFFRLDAVFRELEDQLVIEDGELRVMNPKTKEVRRNKTYDSPLAPEEFIAAYASENEWMVKSKAKGGAGASDSRREEPAERVDNDIAAAGSAKSLDEFRKLKEKITGR